MVAWMYWYMITFYHLLTTYLNNIAVVKAAVVRIADKKLPLGSKLTTGNSNNNINSGGNGSQRFESQDSTMEVELEQANGRLSEQQKRSSVDLSVAVESPVSRQSIGIGIMGGKSPYQQSQAQAQSPQSQTSWSEAGL